MKENDSTSNSAVIPNQNSSHQTNHAIIILASGLSRRLGQAKQLLYKNGVPLIRHMLQLAITTNPQAIIIVIPKGAGKIANEIATLSDNHLNIKTVTNQTPETGMGDSLYIAIEALTHFVNDKNFNHKAVDRVLIMGVDQVLLDKQHLMALLAGNHAVVASSYASEVDWQYLDHTAQILDKLEFAKPSQKNIIGMPLIIHYALLKYWQTQLVGDEGLRHLIRGLSSEQMQIVINPQLSYDIDTPEQLIYAQKRGWLDKQY